MNVVDMFKPENSARLEAFATSFVFEFGSEMLFGKLIDEAGKDNPIFQKEMLQEGFEAIQEYITNSLTNMVKDIVKSEQQ